MSKVWFVTGASRGLGTEICRAALAAGDTVVATARKAEDVVSAFEGTGDRLLPLSLDVTELGAAEVAVAAVIARFGRIDVLVNNAGYGQLRFFETLTPEQIERQFATERLRPVRRDPRRTARDARTALRTRDQHIVYRRRARVRRLPRLHVE